MEGGSLISVVLFFPFCTCLNMDLHDAVKHNDIERVRMFVEQGADKDKGDSYGITPLYLASNNGFLDVAQYLVEHGATLDTADSGGWTPLIVAASNGQREVCRYLLEQGADRDKATNNGYTPLHYAAFFGHLEIAILLMSYGADLNARNYEDKLPIDVGYLNTEEIKQAIRDEPRRRMDEAPGKRATEQDRHPNAATSASAQQEGDEQAVKKEQSNKRLRLDEGGVVAEVETKVAEEDEDSEPSSDEDEDDH